MGFNRKDLQDDDDFNFDDDFKFDEEPNGDSFKFDDDAPDIDLDSDNDAGFGFESDDMPELNEDAAPQRSNRTFIIIAALMVILFLAGLGAVLFLATQNNGPTPLELTRSAIETQNAETLLLAQQTGTAAVLIAQDQTATASVPTATPTLTREPTVTPTPTEVAPPTLDPTVEAANILLTQVASEATQTAAAALITPTVAVANVDAVNATGTALAALLGGVGGDLAATQTAQAILNGNGGIPTQESGGIGVVPTRLPDSGFFDDVGAGNNVALVALLALGLVGVIGISRVVRAKNT
ncbi:MAG: hypothetical protein LCI00_13750 [Chloroflexi bacterium]|nr:hypothetical protein [Chloroflexota bacterium]MCC6892272.1 hypothetical protein [Anaerolineae bacterium]